MEKDFDNWNTKKKNLNTVEIENLLNFHEREIWWCALGINIGVEMDGKNDDFERPVLIIKKFNKQMALVVPLTKSERETKYHYKLNLADDKDSSVVLSQLRLLSGERFLRLIKKIPDPNFDEIVRGINSYLLTGIQD
jgi:mRNA interferase MazF